MINLWMWLLVINFLKIRKCYQYILYIFIRFINIHQYSSKFLTIPLKDFDVVLIWKNRRDQWDEDGMNLNESVFALLQKPKKPNEKTPSSITTRMPRFCLLPGKAARSRHHHFLIHVFACFRISVVNRQYFEFEYSIRFLYSTPYYIMILFRYETFSSLVIFQSEYE